MSSVVVAYAPLRGSFDDSTSCTIAASGSDWTVDGGCQPSCKRTKMRCSVCGVKAALSYSLSLLSRPEELIRRFCFHDDDVQIAREWEDGCDKVHISFSMKMFACDDCA